MNQFIITACLCVLGLSLSSQPCHGDSVLKFSSTPKVIKENLTRSVTLRCEVAAAQGKTASTDKDIDSVNHYWVTYGEDEYVATVTNNETARGFIDEGNLRVSGSAEGMGYLELTWSNPSAMRTGLYKCQLNAKSKKNTLVQLRKRLRITSEEPTIADLLERINQNEQDRKDETKQRKEADEELKQADNKQVSTWRCLSRKVGFMATLTKTGHTHVKGGQTVVFGHVITNIGHAYNPSYGRFTAGSPGLYAFTLTVHTKSQGQESDLNIKVNNMIVTSELVYNGGTMHNSASARAVVQLSAGDVVTVWADDSFSTHSMFQESHGVIKTNTFSGELIQPDCPQ